MLAKLVHARIRPERLDLAARAVMDDLAPAFVAHPGARLGCWMANRTNGHVLAMTLWEDESCLHAEQAADGAERTQVAERIGLEVHAIETLEVVAVHDLDAGLSAGEIAPRWARVTWVEAVEPAALDHLDELHASIAPDQSSSDGFCASYWLADHRTGDGMALSTWASAAQLRDGEPDSRHRRRLVERTLGCHVAMVGEYQALGVTVRATPELQLHLFDDPSVPARVGGPVSRQERPSGRVAV